MNETPTCVYQYYTSKTQDVGVPFFIIKSGSPHQKRHLPSAKIEENPERKHCTALLL